jgi:hypothetical protein
LFAWAASRFFVEARRGGELELLLTTPLGSAGIVSSQWIWLRRTLFWPVVLMAGTNLLASYEILRIRTRYSNFQFLFTEGMTIVLIIPGVVALFWAGLWFGCKARSQAGAVVRTLVLAWGVPYLIGNLGSPLLLYFLMFTIGAPAFALSIGLSYLSTIARLFYYLWLWRWAARRLRAEFGHPVAPRFNWGEFIARLFSPKALYK